MKATFWLARRELSNRTFSFITAVALIAVATALCSATELLSRAREASVGAQIDRMGPALRLIPHGQTYLDLVRFEMNGHFFPENSIRQIREELHSLVRAVEGRLLRKEYIEGVETHIIGFDPDSMVSHAKVLAQLDETQVALGTGLAQKLGRKRGDRIQLKGSEFRVAAILPERGDTEDFALFLPLGRLQSISRVFDVINEVRVFPRSGGALQDIGKYLESNHPEIHVINTYRGEAAEEDVGDSLKRHQWVIYLITAIFTALCVSVWSYLNASERQLEISTIVAIGGTRVTVLVTLLIRAVLVGALGTLLGYAAGTSIALAQDINFAQNVVWSWTLFLAMLGGVVSLSIMGALPAAILSAFRQPVRVLQESTH